MRLHTETVNKMRWWIGWWVTGDAARHGRGYMAASRMSYYLQSELAVKVDPAERAELLRCMAACDATMARAHVPTFGLVPAAVSGGSDMSKSHLFSAQLLYLLADVEECVATGADLQQGQVKVAGFSVWSWGVAVHMASTPDLQERHAMLADLYDAVHPIVGGQAAEVLACIPAPDCPPLRPYVPPAERATATTV